jgi:hypothetical protein
MTLPDLLAAGTVYNAQRLNALLAQHWRSFARQPYFDEQGIFISAVVSAPLLLTMFVQLVSRKCTGMLHAALADLTTQQQHSRMGLTVSPS